MPPRRGGARCWSARSRAVASACRPAACASRATGPRRSGCPKSAGSRRRRRGGGSKPGPKRTGAANSKRESLSTQPANSRASSTCRRIRSCSPSTPKERMTNHSFSAESPPQRDLPIAIVDHGPRLGGLVAQVFGQDAQRADQRGPVGHEEAVAVEIGEHPLVRIEAIAVGQFQAGEELAELGAQAGRAGQGPVDVQPESLLGGRRRRFHGSGSMAVEDVVPTVAQAKQGFRPAARSAAIASASRSGRMA